jgi:hypothetical protein
MKRKVDPEVAEILSVVRLCQAMNTLPRPGGLFDQDALFVYLLERVLLADQKKAELDQARSNAKG